MSDKIRVILFREGDAWVAQGLERDICVQADRLDELYGRFEVAVRLEGSEPGGMDRIAPAPKYFFDLWDRKSGAFKPENADARGFDFGLAA